MMTQTTAKVDDGIEVSCKCGGYAFLGWEEDGTDTCDECGETYTLRVYISYTVVDSQYNFIDVD